MRRVIRDCAHDVVPYRWTVTHQCLITFAWLALANYELFEEV